MVRAGGTSLHVDASCPLVRASKLSNGSSHSSGQYQPQSGQRIILDLWPQQHSQWRALGVSLGQSQRGLGENRCGRGPLE